MRVKIIVVLGLTFLLGACAAEAAFPRLNAAEQNIRQAISELRAAPPRFNGHKAAALRYLRAAYHQIQIAKSNFDPN